jgi:hypothetical protein
MRLKKQLMAGKTLSRLLVLFQDSLPSRCLICFAQLMKGGLGLTLGIWIWVGAFFSGFRTYV